MKKFLSAIILVFILLTSSHSQAFDFYVFGINLKWLKNAEAKDYGLMVLGGVASLATHEIGHGLYAKYENVGIDFNGSNYNLCDDASRYQKINIARSGFITQSLVGLLLTSIDKTRDSYFTKGYTGYQAVQLATYNYKADKNHNDFKTIKENGGNEDLFFWTIAGVSAHNLLRQEW